MSPELLRQPIGDKTSVDEFLSIVASFHRWMQEETTNSRKRAGDAASFRRLASEAGRVDKQFHESDPQRHHMLTQLCSVRDTSDHTEL